MRASLARSVGAPCAADQEAFVFYFLSSFLFLSFFLLVRNAGFNVYYGILYYGIMSKKGESTLQRGFPLGGDKLEGYLKMERMNLP